MREMIKTNGSALFDGITPEDRVAVLDCIGYHTVTYRKGDVIALESEKVKQIGVILSGSVDMIKEDFWGNKTMLLRMRQNEVFGETFACGTGACATAMACILNGKTEDEVLVHLVGGDLLIQYDRKTNHIFMTGPATEVFSGEIQL